MKPPLLTPIRLPIKNQDQRIDYSKTYLVNYGGEWTVGHFEHSDNHEDWEWIFSGMYDPGFNVGYGSDFLKAVFEFKEQK